MENVLERLPDGARVLVIRLRSLGDCVLTTPALALLKQFRPDLSVAVVVEERFAPLFEGNPDIDRLVIYGPEAFPRAQVERYDMVIGLDKDAGAAGSFFAGARCLRKNARSLGP